MAVCSVMVVLVVVAVGIAIVVVVVVVAVVVIVPSTEGIAALIKIVNAVDLRRSPCRAVVRTHLLRNIAQADAGPGSACNLAKRVDGIGCS